ncbi:DNA translocase FtsK [Candidatus Uhrbacteria bacterium]|nr:DNA translocase FtsK [Candidatus Uhrbacteria bacterium]
MARKSRNHESSKKRDRRDDEPALSPKAKKELVAIFLTLVAVITFLGFFEAAGPAGGVIDSALGVALGLNRFLFPLGLLVISASLLWPERFQMKASASFGVFLYFVSSGSLLNLLRAPVKDGGVYLDVVGNAGGYVGLLMSYPLTALLGYWGGLLLVVAVLAASLVLTFNVSLHEMAARVVGLRHRAWPWPFGHRGSMLPVEELVTVDDDAPAFAGKSIADGKPEPAGTTLMSSDEDHEDAPVVVKKKARKISIPVDLLEHKNSKPTAGDIHGRMMVIKKTLENFGILVEMGEVSVGPTVTQFTLKPSEGVKLSRITSLSNDLALALAAHPIRIEAPIPGKSLVGIEVPNQSVAIVGLREILESKEFAQRKTGLTVCLGKDVAGKPWTADLGKMPHLLVAGATGSGKTVCLNTIILSLLYQNGPDELKLILVDPKRVELPVYNGIPHLLTQSITEVPKTINALKWSIGEMDRRFDLLSKSGKRDITSYNESADEKMPYLVLIIDELADLMVASASEVEASIIRLAQMARAVGIHLVVATQRPSVDVITGLIKANITSRIAFSVASATDSRTILDTSGAEKLIGRGDMLFLSSELSKPKRIQGCYVGDGDIRRVVDHVVSQLDEPVEYVDGITEKRGLGSTESGFDDANDELLEEARETVVRAGKASASFLQRRLKVGYARAARLLDLLEERGIIGPGDGAKPRQILVSPIHDVDGAHFSSNDDSEE